jgi:EAL domain-containing protein (putative c-di-GMP-specific phosphodiesterase class I)
VDDFGSGYSNFENIIKLDIGFIKINGTLIKEIDTDLDMLVIVENIFNFSDKLGKKVIAEYVHNKAVFDEVKKIGIHFSQGYYFSKPEPEL